jgi:hypothetical protein
MPRFLALFEETSNEWIFNEERSTEELREEFYSPGGERLRSGIEGFVAPQNSKPER